jgi:osomolarity two-component system, sensor histidine kinase SLN1
VIVLLVFPIAHYSVRPIRRLREATEKSTRPPSYSGGGRGSLERTRSGDAYALMDEKASRTSAKGIMAKFNFPWKKADATPVDPDIEDAGNDRRISFRVPQKVKDRKHFIKDELSDLTRTFNEMTEELTIGYENLEDRVQQRTLELEMSKKAAEAANESKTLFIANISHELKTPLNGILGMCAVCMGEEDITKVRRSMGIVYQSGELLLHLLNDLLTFSKNQIGNTVTLEEKEFRLIDVATQVLTIFDKQAKDGKISLSLSYVGPAEIESSNAAVTPWDKGYGPPGTGKIKNMSLWGDHSRILQVLINLVNNSLKFTPAGGSVHVRIRCTADDGTSHSSRAGSVGSANSSHRGRGRSSSPFSGSKSGSFSIGAQSPQNIDTALSLNALEDKTRSQVSISESSVHPPSNARPLIFEFDVVDTGPGIPESQQERVFEPFVQGDIGLSRQYGGTGLGLSICSQLAKLMRGTISLESTVGKGSTFTMRIPLMFIKETAESDFGSRRDSMVARPVSNAAGPSDIGTLSRSDSNTGDSIKSMGGTGNAMKSSKPRLVGLSQPYFATTSPPESPEQQMESMELAAADAARHVEGKIRILVAEDNVINQEVVLRMLKLEDIYGSFVLLSLIEALPLSCLLTITDITLAKDGQEALDKVKQSMADNQPYDLVFMDIQMPNLDGLQSTRLIRKTGYSAPIVALTAFAEDSNIKDCMESGMNFFLAKPIRRPALKQVLTKYCSPIPEEDELEKSQGDLKNPVDEPVSPRTTVPNAKSTMTNGDVAPGESYSAGSAYFPHHDANPAAGT